MAHQETPSTVNPDSIVPKAECEVEGEILTLPELYDTVKTLDQTVDVDYYVPDCPRL